MVVSHVSTPIATWSWLILLLTVHLLTNHAAVRAISMHTLNRQRANFVFSALLANSEVLTPFQVSKKECVFEWDGVLRWKGGDPIAQAQIGVSLTELLICFSPARSATGSIRDSPMVLERLAEIFRLEEYLAWYDSKRRMAFIVLKDKASSTSHLKAWAHILWTAQRWQSVHATSAGDYYQAMLRLLSTTLGDLSSRWEGDVSSLKAAGWDLDSASLETTSATRIYLQPGDKSM